MRVGSFEMVVVVVVIVCVSCALLLKLYSAAVVAAPAAADAPATIARVNLDILGIAGGMREMDAARRLYVPPAALVVTGERSFCCRFQTRGEQHASANEFEHCDS